MNDIHSLSHTKWNCKYHVVFILFFHFITSEFIIAYCRIRVNNKPRL